MVKTNGAKVKAIKKSGSPQAPITTVKEGHGPLGTEWDSQQGASDTGTYESAGNTIALSSIGVNRHIAKQLKKDVIGPMLLAPC